MQETAPFYYSEFFSIWKRKKWYNYLHVKRLYYYPALAKRIPQPWISGQQPLGEETCQEFLRYDFWASASQAECREFEPLHPLDATKCRPMQPHAAACTYENTTPKKKSPRKCSNVQQNALLSSPSQQGTNKKFEEADTENGTTFPEHEGRLMSLDEVAAYLGIKRDTVYKWIKRKNLPAHKVGHLWKFRKNEIEKWIEKST